MRWRAPAGKSVSNHEVESAADAGGAHVAWPSGSGRRPRPLGRLGSGRLPAVHPPPIHPVVCRGPYLVSPVGSLV